MEMMLVSNDDIFDNLCFEYYRGALLGKQLREKILIQLKYLSSIRMYNEREEWGVNLKGISVNKAWIASENRIDNSVFVDKLNSINGGIISGSRLQIIEQEVAKEWQEEDYYNNTQGHDFSTLFATICNQYRKKGIKYGEIEASARCIFRWSDFKKTKLFQMLNQYAQSNSLRILRQNMIRLNDT